MFVLCFCCTGTKASGLCFQHRCSSNTSQQGRRVIPRASRLEVLLCIFASLSYKVLHVGTCRVLCMSVLPDRNDFRAIAGRVADTLKAPIALAVLFCFPWMPAPLPHKSLTKGTFLIWEMIWVVFLDWSAVLSHVILGICHSRLKAPIRALRPP